MTGGGGGPPWRARSAKLSAGPASTGRSVAASSETASGARRATDDRNAHWSATAPASSGSRNTVLPRTGARRPGAAARSGSRTRLWGGSPARGRTGRSSSGPSRHVPPSPRAATPRRAPGLRTRARGASKKTQTWPPLPDRERSNAAGTPLGMAGVQVGERVQHPGALVEVAREQRAGVAAQERVDADRCPTAGGATRAPRRSAAGSPAATDAGATTRPGSPATTPPCRSTRSPTGARTRRSGRRTTTGTARASRRSTTAASIGGRRRRPRQQRRRPRHGVSGRGPRVQPEQRTEPRVLLPQPHQLVRRVLGFHPRSHDRIIRAGSVAPAARWVSGWRLDGRERSRRRSDPTIAGCTNISLSV